LGDGLVDGFVGVGLLVLENVALGDLERVEELGMFVEPEALKVFFGNALLALEGDGDADAVGAERHCEREREVGWGD